MNIFICHAPNKLLRSNSNVLFHREDATIPDNIISIDSFTQLGGKLTFELRLNKIELNISQNEVANQKKQKYSEKCDKNIYKISFTE